MPTLPAVIVTLLLPFEHLFDPRTWRKAQLLAMGAILSPGKRTVSSALNILGIGQHGDFAVYHHVLNRAQWSPLQLSRALAAGGRAPWFVHRAVGVRHDETVERRWGRKIAAKGRYRDRPGGDDPRMQWVSLMLLTRSILGVAVFDRAGGSGYDRRKGRRHKTVTDYAQQMLVCLRRWLPDRDLVGGRWRLRQARVPAALPEHVKADCRRHQTAQRSLYQPAPPRRPGQIGRPRVVR